VVLPVQLADGTVAWWDWSVRRELDGCLLAAVADVTAERRRQQRLAVRRRLLAELIEQAAAAIGVRDLAGRRCLANRRYDAWFPDDADGSLDADEQEVVRSGISVASERRREAGSSPEVLLVVRFPLRDGTGQVTHVATVATDVTDRVRAEAAARAGERLVDVLFRVSPDVVSVLDRSGHAVQVSAALGQLLGVDHVPLDDLAAVVHPDDRAAVERWTARLLEGLPASEGRLRHRLLRPDGQVVHVQVSGRRLVDAAGEPVGAVLVSRDVTAAVTAAERQAEAEAAVARARAAKEAFLAQVQTTLVEPLQRLVAAVERLPAVMSASGSRRQAVEAMVGAGRQLAAVAGTLAAGTAAAPSAEPEPPVGTVGEEVGGTGPTDGGDGAAEVPSGETGSAVRVLHVEDDEASGELVRRVLARYGDVELVHVDSVAAALAAVRRGRPDLVLLDLGLPDASGEAVLARLRAEPATADVPVVVVSADATAGQVERLRSAGADGYLTKPVHLASLVAAVDACRRRR
jgi:PAS domain S-box-containing protein